MDVILYAAINKSGDRLLNVIDTITLDGQIEIYRKFELFSQRLRQPGLHTAITVIAADSKKQFSDILDVGDLIKDIRTILILPDRNHATVSHGHSLYPRFISYVDSDFKDVAAVLSRMSEQFQANKKQTGGENKWQN